MQAALVVLGRRGVEAGIIDDVTTLAGTSRGTFYNYFRTNEEMLQSVAVATGNEMMAAVMPIVDQYSDPAERIAAGVRNWLVLSGRNPHLAAFFRRAGLYILEQDSRVRVDMPRDVIAGMESGRLTIDSLELGFDVIAGTVLSAINTSARGNPPADYSQRVAARILMALGVASEQACAISRLDLEEAVLPEGSIILGARAFAETGPGASED